MYLVSGSDNEVGIVSWACEDSMRSRYSLMLGEFVGSLRWRLFSLLVWYPYGSRLGVGSVKDAFGMK
jgi:hypothetical protein